MNLGDALDVLKTLCRSLAWSPAASGMPAASGEPVFAADNVFVGADDFPNPEIGRYPRCKICVQGMEPAGDDGDRLQYVDIDLVVEQQSAGRREGEDAILGGHYTNITQGAGLADIANAMQTHLHFVQATGTLDECYLLQNRTSAFSYNGSTASFRLSMVGLISTGKAI